MSILQLWLESCWRQARNIKDWDLELDLELIQVPNSKLPLLASHHRAAIPARALRHKTDAGWIPTLKLPLGGARI